MLSNEFENYLKLHVSSRYGQRQYLSRINLFFQTHNEFNQKTVNSFLASCVDKNLKPNTFNGYMNALKQYMKFLKVEIEFPKQKRPNKNKKAFLTLKEIEDEILPYFKYIFTDVGKRKLVIRLMFCSGLRPCEILNLKKQDLNFKNNWITVRDTKDKEDRTTVMVANLQPELKKICEEPEGEYVFNITKGYIDYIFKKINEMLNYKRHLNAYQLRHGFAHHCLKDGIDLKRLKEMMGHWDIKMTEEYLTLEPHEIIDVAFKKFKFKKGEK